MWSYVTQFSLLFFIICLISSCSNLSLRSECLYSYSIAPPSNICPPGQEWGDCPASDHLLCPDDRTCCDLGDSCCPDPEANTGIGCCNAGQNASEYTGNIAIKLSTSGSLLWRVLLLGGLHLQQRRVRHRGRRRERHALPVGAGHPHQRGVSQENLKVFTLDILRRLTKALCCVVK